MVLQAPNRYQLTWCLMFVFLSAIRAQDSPLTLPYTHYTVANGLPQMQVRAVFIDEDGLVWLGTQGGLAVFDGSAVHTLQDTGHLAEEYFMSISRGESGLIASSASGTYSFDGSQSRRFADDGLSPESFVLFEDKSGRTWFMDRGSERIVLIDQKRAHAVEDIFTELSRYTLRMAWGYRTWNKVYLMDHRNRLITLDLDTHRISVDSTTFSPDDQLALLKHNRTSPDDMMIVRYGTERKTLNPVTDIYRWSKGRFQLVAQKDNQSGLLRALSDNAPIGYVGFADSKTRLFILRDGFYRSDMTPDINAIRFVVEAHHKLYIGSDEGFFVVHGDGLEDLHFPACDYAWSVTPGDSEDIFLACYKAGIFRLDESGRTRQHFVFPGLTSIDGLGNQVLSNTLPTRHHRLWGSTTGIITLRDGEQNLGHVFTKASAEAFATDPLDDAVLVGTKHILRFPAALDGPADTIRLSDDLVGGGYVNDLKVLPERQLWVAAPAGIECIGLGDQSARRFTASNGLLPCIGAVTLDPDAQGNLWSGGTCGLMVKRNGSAVFERILPDLISHRVNQVEILPDNRLVCASNNTLYLLDISGASARLLHIYSQKNGLDLYEPSENGSCLTHDRYIWLPGVAGIQRLDLLRVPATYGPPTLTVRRINGNHVPFLKDSSTAPVIRGHAALLDLMLADHSGHTWKYQFIRRGSKPSPWQSADEILVSGLQHGRNEILLRAAWNPSDPDSWIERKYLLVSQLPFLARQKVQFFLLGLTILLAGWGIWALRASRRDAQRVQQLRADLYRNRLLSIQAYLNPHFLFNTLTSIQDRILHQDARQGNDMIVRLSRVFRKVLDTGTFEEERMPRCRLTEEIALIEDMVYLHNRQLHTPVIFELDIDPAVRLADPMIPPMLIQPFVENAFKHAFPSDPADKHISVSITGSADNFTIVIEDDGIGIPHPAGPTPGNSMGTRLVTERMAILKALGVPNTIAISKRQPRGTRVEITINPFQ